MTADPKIDAAIVLHRFGFGPAGDAIATIAGGALKGGRVIADWPGLHPANPLEDRDLAPTTDVRAVLKGVLKDHLRADDRALVADVFPGSDGVKPIAGLVASA